MAVETPTVFVVDDDPSVRRALERLLRAGGLRVASFASAREFLASAWGPFSEGEAAPGCLVLDVNLPGPSGLDLQRELSRAGLPIPIVFITGHGDIPMSVRAMKAGAVDFLPKPFEDEDLLGAVHRALERDERSRRRRCERAGIEERIGSLTPREREVFALVVEGRLNKQIAAALGVAEKTVKVHRARVMEKMGADSLAELVRMAERVDRER